jgi:hypothetical protein
MDRSYGGVSLIMHVEGTNRPNSPLCPEFVKADVYFPGYLYYEDARFLPIVSRFTQQFITDIGLPVIKRWEHCARLKWSMTQGHGNPPPPPYPEKDEQPVAIPNGSSIFVIHGSKVTADDAALHQENDSDDGYSQFEPSSMELQLLDVIEKNAYLEDEMSSLRQELIEMKKALSDALAREYTLNAQRSPFTPSRHSSTSPSRRTLTYTSTSPLRAPLTPRKLTSFNSSSPAGHSGSSRLPETPLFEESSHVWGGQVPRSTESFADFHEFLDFHNISHLTSTLEYIRNNIPISSWPEHMEKLAIPSEKIGSIVSLLLKASSASSQ